jgi:Helicase HerA, central domain
MASLQLGFRLDPKAGAPGTDPLAIDSGDLTTHGVIVGMTGSGKTGLGIVMLEEALLAGIPALVLDPKGDMGNLLLTFPSLSPQDFRPWVNEDDARTANLSLDDFAAKTATDWRNGLESQGIGPERIAALRQAADFTIYTPGSDAGVPLNVIGSLATPPLSWETEAEVLRDEIEGTVTSLLGLVGIQADPLSSRESVLLSNLIETAWRAGQSLDLGTLIAQVQTPPLRKLGVFELDTFFPQKDRTELALKLNSLVASPSFAAWTEGQALDPTTLLRAPDGKPRAAIVYLAHLSDQERQFVVTLILSRLVTWMRGQSGTTDLRTLVYMDEVFGFVPPTAAPPAKKPILTILKQGRAFGVGFVLSTQNPVDLDYKAMANAGIWLVGRLQTENDKARVLEGLKSAAGDTDVATLDKAIGGLQKRDFLLVSAKGKEPALFQTRWAMSYLRGPLTKDQIATLMKEAPRPAPAAQPAAAAPGAAAVPPTPSPADPGATPVAPPVAAGIPVGFLDPAAPWAAQVGAMPGGLRLRAFLAGRVGVRFDDTAAQVDERQEYEALYPLDGDLDLDKPVVVDYDDRDFAAAAPAGAAYVLPSVPLGDTSFFRNAGREIERRLVDTQVLELMRNPQLKVVSRPGETGEAFAARCDAAAQAAADAEAAKIKEKLEAQQEKLQRALELAQRRVEEVTTDQRSRQAHELLAGAGAVLGAFLGGRRSARSLAGAIGSAASRRGMSARTAERKETAQAKVTRAQDDLEEIEQRILDEIQAIDAKWKEVAAAVETIAIRPEATDVRVERLALVWVPSA